MHVTDLPVSVNKPAFDVVPWEAAPRVIRLRMIESVSTRAPITGGTKESAIYTLQMEEYSISINIF